MPEQLAQPLADFLTGSVGVMSGGEDELLWQLLQNDQVVCDCLTYEDPYYPHFGTKVEHPFVFGWALALQYCLASSHQSNTSGQRSLASSRSSTRPFCSRALYWYRCFLHPEFLPPGKDRAEHVQDLLDPSLPVPMAKRVHPYQLECANCDSMPRPGQTFKKCARCLRVF